MIERRLIEYYLKQDKTERDLDDSVETTESDDELDYLDELLRDSKKKIIVDNKK